MLIGAVVLPFPELLDAVLLLWHSRNLEEVAAGGALLQLLPLLLLVLTGKGALLVRKYSKLFFHSSLMFRLKKAGAFVPTKFSSG
jgi:hypothetical protein